MKRESPKPAKAPTTEGNDPDNGKRMKQIDKEALPIHTPKPETGKPGQIVEPNRPERVG